VVACAAGVRPQAAQEPPPLHNCTANGAPASVVCNDSVGGANFWAFAVSPSSQLVDFALDAALCQRALVIGRDTVTGAPLTATSTPTLAQSQAVQAGVNEVRLSGNLRGKPTLNRRRPPRRAAAGEAENSLNRARAMLHREPTHLVASGNSEPSDAVGIDFVRISDVVGGIPVSSRTADSARQSVPLAVKKMVLLA
jgi:hypothetical protein